MEETGNTRGGGGGEERRGQMERESGGARSGLWKMDGDNKRKELVNHMRGRGETL